MDDKQLTKSESDSVDPDDIVWGCEEIAKTINKPVRATFHMLKKGYLPATKVGNLWSASKRRLRQHVTGEAR